MITLNDLKQARPLTPKFSTLEQTHKKALMSSLIRSKWDKYDRLEAVDQLPPLEYFGSAPVWLGSWSRTSTALREKYVLSSVAVRPDDTAPALCTPSELARTWVDVTVEKRLRATRRQGEFWDEYHHNAPAYARTGLYKDMVYLDLKSAYWSIMQVVGWGAEYHHDMIVRRYPVDDFPFPHIKMARNALATVALDTPSQMWHDGRIIEKSGKRIINKSIYYLCVDILQAIALDMLEFRPVYINTDGYIIPRHFEEFAIRKIGERWGLYMERRHAGNAVITGIGSYQIGSHKTRRIQEFGIGGGGVNHKVPAPMLQKWFRFLSDLFPPVY